MSSFSKVPFQHPGVADHSATASDVSTAAFHNNFDRSVTFAADVSSEIDALEGDCHSEKHSVTTCSTADTEAATSRSSIESRQYVSGHNSTHSSRICSGAASNQRPKNSGGSTRSGSSSSSGGKKSGGSLKDKEARAAEKERIASTKRFMKDKYSTTSTIYATQFIECPDFPKAMFCIACIIQSVIFDYVVSCAARRPPAAATAASSGNSDSSVCDMSSTCSGLSGGGRSWKDSDDDSSGAMAAGGGGLYKELRIFPQLPYHLGGVQDPATISPEILEKETMNDPLLKEKVLSGEVPTIDTILRFITWLHQSAAFSSECNIIAFIYIKRIIGEVTLRMDNWRGIWTGAVVLAQKVWDDRPLRTSSFGKVLPGVERYQLRDLEMKIFNLLNFSTNVRPSVYARYYFELREIFKCLVGPQANLNSRKKPLSILNKQLMEQRTNLDSTAAMEQQQQHKQQLHSKGKAIEAAAIAARAEQQRTLQLLQQQQQQPRINADEFGIQSNSKMSAAAASDMTALEEELQRVAVAERDQEQQLQRTPYTQHQHTPQLRERINLLHQNSNGSDSSNNSNFDSKPHASSGSSSNTTSGSITASISFPRKFTSGESDSRSSVSGISMSVTNSPMIPARMRLKLTKERMKTTDDLDLPLKPSLYVLS